MPFFGRESVKYGGNTSCVKLETCGHTVILDCGSGLVQFAEDIKNTGVCNADILVSHLHLDHIIGLMAFSPLWDSRNNIRIFTKSRDERPLAAQVFGCFKPPYWPVDIEKMSRAQMVAINGENSFMLAGGIKVKPLSARHPDDTTIFRIEIEAENKSIVYLLDYEIGEDLASDDRLVEFCKNADTVIFDSAYLPEDYPVKCGYGHSHYRAGMKLAELSGCAHMIFCHFTFEYADAELDAAKESVDSVKFSFAYDGMEVIL